VAEKHPRVLAYVKNQGLGLEVPYLLAGEPRRYRPDFILRINDGQAQPLNLIVEIKGYRGEDAIEKANTMHSYWVPGVNNLGSFGRWAFVEFTEVFQIQAEFNKLIQSLVAESDQAA
jgi:type III restriction enzyme